MCVSRVCWQFVGAASRLGKPSGFMTVRDSALAPEQIGQGGGSTWKVAGTGWVDAPDLRCMPSKPMPPADPATDGQFVDAAFPPTEASVRSAQSKGELTTIPDCWMRVPQLLGADTQGAADVKLFDEIDPTDIVQGRLGNCWLLAALACLAEFPVLVKSLLKETSLSSDGGYTFRFFDASVHDWVAVTIDDAIPCHWRYGNPKPCFMQPAAGQREAWPLLYEKAFAKFCGTFQELEGGFTSWAFSVLLGHSDDDPIRVFAKDADGSSLWRPGTLDPELIVANGARSNNHASSFKMQMGADRAMRGTALFEVLRNADAEDYLMAASIDGGVEKKRSDGLVEGHAFSVLAAVEVHGFQLVQVHEEGVPPHPPPLHC